VEVNVMVDHTFRCYAYKASEDRYIAYCLDLTLMGEGKTMREAIDDLEEAIFGYLESVYELGWDSNLIPRRARSYRWLEYYKLLLTHTIKTLFTGEFGNFQTFQERFEDKALVYA